MNDHAVFNPTALALGSLLVWSGDIMARLTCWRITNIFLCVCVLCVCFCFCLLQFVCHFPQATATSVAHYANDVPATPMRSKPDAKKHTLLLLLVLQLHASMINQKHNKHTHTEKHTLTKYYNKMWPVARQCNCNLQLLLDPDMVRSRVYA